MSEYETTVERDGEDVPVTVEYTYHRATRGARDSLCGIRGAGPPLEPDEPAWAEIDKVTGPDGSVIDIDMASRQMVMHMMDTRDPEAAVAAIRRDFEPGLVALFGEANR